MKDWIEGFEGSPSNEEVIDHCKLMIVHGEPRNNPIAKKLAELCIERLQPEPKESDFVRCRGCGGCRVRTGDVCLSCGVVS